MSILLGALAMLLAGPQDLSPADRKKGEQLRLAVEKTPDDPAANLALGKFLCFVGGKWDEGLPFMAKGGEDGFAHVARKDLEPKENHLFSIEVADLWLSLEKANKHLAPRLRERAAFHFGEAWPKVNDPVWKDKTRERILSIQRTGKPAPNLGPYPSKGWFPLNPKCNAGVDSEFVRSGRFAVKLITPNDPGPSGMAWFRTEAMPCTPGQKVVARCWVLTNLTDGGNDHLALSFFDAADKSIPGTPTPRALMDHPIWKPLEVRIEVPAKAVRFQVGFIRMCKQGTVWVDDFSLTVDGKELLTNGGFEAR